MGCMSANGVNGGGSDGQVLNEIREMGRGLNDVKVSIATLQAGQTAMAQRMDAYERQAERVATAISDFERFRSGAGVKLGVGTWVGALVGTVVIAAVVSAVIAVVKRPEPAPQPVQQMQMQHPEVRQPPPAHPGP